MVWGPHAGGTKVAANGPSTQDSERGKVKNITSVATLEDLLTQAKSGCAAIFFTSASCPPCKMAYPAYDSLAEEFPKAILIKVDISIARDIAAKYQIRATPTFMTFLHGEKENEWTGASPATLLGNVRLLAHMAFPPHKHLQMHLPTLQRSHGPTKFEKVPPLDKLASKMGKAASELAIKELMDFTTSRQSNFPSATPLPDMSLITIALPKLLRSTLREDRFPILDLLRCALLDVRISEYLVLKAPSLLEAIIEDGNASDMEKAGSEPQALHKTKITALQGMANLFASPQVAAHVLNREDLVENTVSNILDKERPQIREAAAIVLYNIAATEYNARIRQDEGGDGPKTELNPDLRSRIIAAVVESIKSEESGDATRAELLTVGLLLYRAPSSEELDDLLAAVEARDVIANLNITGEDQGLMALKKEVGMLLP